jgi:hypothetical protein
LDIKGKIMGEVSVSLEDTKKGVFAFDRDLEKEIMDMALQVDIIQDTFNTRISRALRVWASRVNMYGGV